MRISRKELFRYSALGLGAAAVGTPDLSSNAEAQSLLGRSNAPRVVIAGGGWGGLTAAKYLKRANRNIDVVVIEQRSQFMSCPISNEWLVDNFPLDFLSYDYGQPAERYGYTFINERITGISRFRKRVTTTAGYINYDYLIIAPGIDYRYEDWFGNDIESANRCRTLYPAAYKAGNELLSLKRKLHSFEEGDFVITVPKGMYRCPPAPYERACLIAGYFKKHRIKGRVVVLDPKPDIFPKGPGFKAAFDELYRQQIDYIPNAEVESVDFENKIVKTSAGEIDFDDAALAPAQKPGALLEMAGGMIGDDGWGNQHGVTCLSHRDSNVYIIGDAFGGQQMPKSGAMSSAQGKNVATHIAARIAGMEATLQRGLILPESTCFSIVNASPREGLGISVSFDWNEESGRLTPNIRSESVRTTQAARATTEWARGSFADLFM